MSDTRNKLYPQGAGTNQIKMILYTCNLAGELFITRFCGCKKYKEKLVDFMEVLLFGMSQVDILCEKVNLDCWRS